MSDSGWDLREKTILGSAFGTERLVAKTVFEHQRHKISEGVWMARLRFRVGPEARFPKLCAIQELRVSSRRPG